MKYPDRNPESVRFTNNDVFETTDNSDATDVDAPVAVSHAEADEPDSRAGVDDTDAHAKGTMDDDPAPFTEILARKSLIAVRQTRSKHHIPAANAPLAATEAAAHSLELNKRPQREDVYNLFLEKIALQVALKSSPSKATPVDAAYCARSMKEFVNTIRNASNIRMQSASAKDYKVALEALQAAVNRSLVLEGDSNFVKTRVDRIMAAGRNELTLLKSVLQECETDAS